METPFVYDRYVTAKNFIGRKKECGILANLLEAGEQVVMYEPPKTGKMSVIQQTLINMRSSGKQFMIVCVDMFNIRTVSEFLLRFGTAVMKAAILLCKPIFQRLSESAGTIVKYNYALGLLIARDLPGGKSGKIFVS